MKVILTVFCFTLTLINTWAQGQLVATDTLRLSTVITHIKDTSTYRFSYLDKLIENETIQNIPEGLSFDNLLDYLSRSTSLVFEQAGPQYIIVRAFEKRDRINVCGFLYNKEGHPVEGATIVSIQRGNGAVTDSSGRFQIDSISPFQDLQISHVSYQSRLLPVQSFFSTRCPQIVLKDNIPIMEPVLIQNYLTPGIDKVNQKLIIDPTQLKTLPGLIEPDILQSIQLAPGVTNPYETASGLFVRGSTPDQNLVRWNGIKTYNPSHFFGMLSAFNPYVIDQVSFIKNGASARFGERIAGIIDIQSSDSVAERISGGAGFNMIYGDAYFNIPVIQDKLSVQLSARRSYNDIFETITYKRFSDRVFQNTKITENLDSLERHNQFYFTDFTSKLVYQPTKNQVISFKSLHANNDLDFRSQSTLSEFNDLLKTENEGYALSYALDKTKYRFSVKSNYSSYALRYSFVKNTAGTRDISEKKNLINDYDINAQLEMPVGDSHAVAFGYQYIRNKSRYSFEDKTPDYRLVLAQNNLALNTHAAFMEYQYATPTTQLDVGLRANRYTELSKFYWEPRVSFNQNFFKSFNLSFTGEFRSQALSQIQESVHSDLSLENQVWTLASTDRFPVIDSYQFTSGVSFDKNRWLLHSEIYYKKINGITTLNFGFLNPLDNNFKIGNSEVRGFDFFVRKEINKYKTWMSYSLMETANEFSGFNNNEAFPGNWNIRHSIKWSHFYRLKNLHLSLGWLWHTGKAFTEIIEVSNTTPVRVAFGKVNESNLPVYHRMDFSALYELRSKKNSYLRYRIGVSLLNIYNRKNLINREFRLTPSLENELIDNEVYSLAFTPNLVFRIFW